MPARKKHLIIIHGRATKPSEAEKKRLVKRSVLHGLERVMPAAAQKIRSGDVRFSLAYYGDISNGEMIKAEKKLKSELKGRDAAHNNAPCELPGSYNADLKRLFAHTTFGKPAYQKILKEEPDLRLLDNVASAVSGLLNKLGLSDNVIRAVTPDMGAYLTSRTIGSAVRQRLQQKLFKSLVNDEDVCLVAHSMGCMVSYDVLWKYSRMSEYKKIRDKKITRWITLGNPLGEPGVRDNLYDAHESSDGMYPSNIARWDNFAAKDDFVAHDRDMADDFKDMLRPQMVHGKKRKLVKSIRDVRINNLWAGSSGSNPHKFYGYLDHPKVAKEIANWIQSDSA